MNFYMTELWIAIIYLIAYVGGKDYVTVFIIVGLILGNDKNYNSVLGGKLR